MNDFITIGKITDAHGIRGEVKVFPITDNVRRFNKLKECVLFKEGQEPKADSVVYKVKSARVDRDHALVVFEGTEDRTAAEKLKGYFVAVPRSGAVKLPKDSYFIADLVGLKAIDDTEGELGIVSDVYETGANFVLTVKRKGKQNLEVPFLKAVCYEVNINDGVILMRLPDGLLELYE